MARDADDEREEVEAPAELSFEDDIRLRLDSIANDAREARWLARQSRDHAKEAVKVVTFFYVVWCVCEIADNLIKEKSVK